MTMFPKALALLGCSFALLASTAGAFVSNTRAGRVQSPQFLAAEGESADESIVQKEPQKSTSSLATTEDASFFDGLKTSLQQSLQIAQESNQQGYDFKQTLANVLAGDYDQASVNTKLDAEIQSAPCVMFSWERSPSCVKAIQAFETMKIMDQIKVVPLDDPWEEGNPLRAELGKRVGRSSVPLIFIGGEYVGGFDGGVSDQAPGIQAMAFQGTLRPALEAAGIAFDKQ